MAQIFIANITKQNHDFCYRIPENEKLISQKIGAGQQISIKGDETVFNAIISQHARYGLINLKELERGKKFNGLVYQIDKALNVDAIRAGIHHNDTVMTEIGLEARKAAAVAIDANLAKVAQDAGSKLNSIELEVIEQRKGPADEDEKFQQTISVSHEEQETPRKRGRPRIN